MFTQENTNGYSDAELETLNEALAIFVGLGIDEQNASDMIHNAWQAGITAQEIVQRISSSFGVVGA